MNNHIVLGALLVSSWGILVFAEDLVLYRSVLISYSRVSSGSRTKTTQSLPPNALESISNFVCGNACSRLSWCNLWCVDPTRTTCLLSHFYVVYGFQETIQLDDAQLCYLRDADPDYAVGASIEGDVVSPDYPDREKTNLVDGYYTFPKTVECCHLAVTYYPYVKLDLGGIKPIRRVFMMLQKGSTAAKIYDLEVRVGTEDLTEADFNLYSLFGYFPGPSVVNQEILFTYPAPMMAQYVVIRRLTADPAVCPSDGSSGSAYCVFHVCHLEIS